MNGGVHTIRARDLRAPLRKGVHVLPNLLTTAGLFSGFFSVVATLRGEFEVAAVAVLVAQVFDVLDGRVARVTRTASRFGIEYDSLSDLVAFGVAPALLVYQWALLPWKTWGWLAAALYVTCGALRLARFNVQWDNVEKRHFVGLPIPAAADVVVTTVLLGHYLGGEVVANRHLVFLVLTYVLAGLMVSGVRYYSFKEVELYRRQPFWILLAVILLGNFLVAEPQIFLFVAAYSYALYGPGRWAYVKLRRLERLWFRRSVGADVLTRSLWTPSKGGQ
ncbi:MAG: CDP-diacylglycerol--serine O-phosphatidyltransferase [Candidatus Binatia bacterium]|nr:MAG: CDP-diacylglycerol--serine O-phosphatidyltransferase [Candidatus Binatia bacterium]